MLTRSLSALACVNKKVETSRAPIRHGRIRLIFGEVGATVPTMNLSPNLANHKTKFVFSQISQRQLQSHLNDNYTYLAHRLVLEPNRSEAELFEHETESVCIILHEILPG